MHAIFENVANFAALGPTSAVVLDIDGTVVSAAGHAIQPTQRFYQTVLARGAHVYFVTARPFTPANMIATAAQLHRCGFPMFSGLFMRPPAMRAVGQFKAVIREYIRHELHHRVRVVVGNQWLDLAANTTPFRALSATAWHVLIREGACYIKLPQDTGRKIGATQ